MLFCGNVTGFPAEEKILRAGCVSGHIIGDGKMGSISYIKEEIQVIRERDPAIKSNMEVLLYPSFKVCLLYTSSEGCGAVYGLCEGREP